MSFVDENRRSHSAPPWKIDDAIIARSVRDQRDIGAVAKGQIVSMVHHVRVGRSTVELIGGSDRVDYGEAVRIRDIEPLLIAEIGRLARTPR